MIYLRNTAFYFCFFWGSCAYVIAAVAAIFVARERLRGICDAWSGFHQMLCEKLLRIEVIETGTRPEGRAFYAIKHESMFEAINLPYRFDHPALFAKQELFAIPGWGRVARIYGLIPVARNQGAKALRSMIREVQPLVEDDRPIIIFPEGTRVPHGSCPPLQSGFAALYKLLRLPVVPVAVTSGPSYHRVWKRPGTITLHFGEPIEAGLQRDEIEARVHAGINALNGDAAARGTHAAQLA
ncbi:lysophospholipid acyltransferase family protein [Aurantiacibacter gangjinensis]|nr:lysophospholipid acyltransferase family protein [Aurantiacibacter gangjinensis]APE27771.1 1-acyl-sn-glycerol-3-phosphate acyltransferase [Aurantiacibacter gangjinensis]